MTKLLSVREILDDLDPNPATKERAIDMKDQLATLIAAIYSSGIFYTEAVQAFKKEYITHALRSKNGNKFRTAIELGMHRNTLDRTIAELKLDQRDWDPRLQLPARKTARPETLAAAAGARQA